MVSNKKLAVLINFRDRPSELCFLLLSLRTQTFKDFDIFILDDASGTPVQNYHFLMCVWNKLNDEGNYVFYNKNEFNLGVSKSRQKIVDIALRQNNYEYLLRVDDDCILNPDYIEKLFKVINQGYDLASGVTPFIGQPQFKRESKFIQPIADKVVLDTQGNFIYNGDDCGIEYIDEAIVPLHHFRSCALYRSSIHEKVSYDSRLTKHGFREEEIFSFKCITNGFKLGMNTKAVAWHLLTPSGGERFAESAQMVQTNEQVLKEFTRNLYAEKGDFIAEYNKKLGIIIKPLTNEELAKQTNLIMS